MFNRVRSQLGLKLIPPAVLLPPSGSFELLGGRCIGSVFDWQHPSWLPLQIGFEKRFGDPIRVFESRRDTDHYHRFPFIIELDDISSRDVLCDTTRLFAENAFGARSYLSLDGASQLNLIRQHLGKPRHLIFDIDFAAGGTALSYMRSGWSNPETGFCWTDGGQAKLSIPANISPDCRYELTLTCRPLIAPPFVERQDITVTVNGYSQSVSLDGKTLGFVTLLYPAGSLPNSSLVDITLDLPNAERPSRFRDESKDNRQLALAFRQITLAHLLDHDSEI